MSAIPLPRTVMPSGNSDAAALKSALRSTSELTLTGGAFLFTSSDSIGGATTRLRFQRGSTIQTTAGATVTVDGAIDAGPWQIFSGAGTILFGPNAPRIVEAAWFGSGNAALSAAFAALYATGTVRAQPGGATISANTALGASGDSLQVPAGCAIRPASGVTLTVNCVVDSPPGVTAFDLSLGGTVVVANVIDPQTGLLSVVAPVSSGLGLESTNAGNATWVAHTPTLTPTGGSDAAQVSSALSASKEAILSVGGTFLYNADATVGASGNTLHFQRAAKIKPASGKVVTVACDHDAQDDQSIFDRTAGGTVLFSSNGPRMATPEHFGALRDGTTDDAAAIQAAVDALANAGGGVLRLLRGSYAIHTSITVPSYIMVAGAGRLRTVLLPNGNFPSIQFAASSRHSELLEFNVHPCAYGGHCDGAIDISNLSEGRIDNIEINGTATKRLVGFLAIGDLAGSGPYYNEFEGCIVNGNAVTGSYGYRFAPNGGDVSKVPNGNNINGGHVTACDNVVRIEGGTLNKVAGIVSESIVLDHYYLGVHAAFNRVSVHYYEPGIYTGGFLVFFDTAGSCASNVLDGPSRTDMAFVDTTGQRPDLGTGAGFNRVIIDGTTFGSGLEANITAPTIRLVGAGGVVLGTGTGGGTGPTAGSGLIRVPIPGAGNNYNIISSIDGSNNDTIIVRWAAPDLYYGDTAFVATLYNDVKASGAYHGRVNGVQQFGWGQGFAQVGDATGTYPAAGVVRAAGLAGGQTVLAGVVNAGGADLPMVSQDSTDHVVIGANATAVAGIIIAAKASTGTATITIGGVEKIKADSTGWSVGGHATAATSAAYSTTNHSDSRSLDETGATTAQVAHVLGTLIADLQAHGVIG